MEYDNIDIFNMGYKRPTTRQELKHNEKMIELENQRLKNIEKEKRKLIIEKQKIRSLFKWKINE